MSTRALGAVAAQTDWHTGEMLIEQPTLLMGCVRLGLQLHLSRQAPSASLVQAHAEMQRQQMDRNHLMLSLTTKVKSLRKWHILLSFLVVLIVVLKSHAD